MNGNAQPQKTRQQIQDELRESFAKAVAKVHLLQAAYKTAKNERTANKIELQAALKKARADGRSIRRALEMHMQ
jgi:hypothetical protein